MIFEKKIIESYRAMAYTRCDDNGTAFYFSKEDFPNLNSEPYAIIAPDGHRLQGYLYFYKNPIPNRLIVFEHGFGGGHRSYMKEIEMLAGRGYLVLAYDHTGCMQSEGESPNGMAESLADLDCVIGKIKNDRRFLGYDISVIGHSWGGFSTMNISALHPEISHVVVISGFVSVGELIKTFFPGILKGYRKAVMKIEAKANPYYSNFDGVKTLSESNAKVLLIYSDNDKMCKKVHYDLLKKSLSDKPNIKFLLTENKGHNPNYTKDAVLYLDEYIKLKTKKIKNGELNTNEEKASFIASFDWDRMTRQDEFVWKEIFNLLES